MALCLHNPASTAHLEELRDRLASQLVCPPSRGRLGGEGAETVEMLLDVVRSMDQGAITPKEAIETFTRYGYPSFTKWLVDMVDEGVYLDTRLSKVA